MIAIKGKRQNRYPRYSINCCYFNQISSFFLTNARLSESNCFRSCISQDGASSSKVSLDAKLGHCSELIIKAVMSYRDGYFALPDDALAIAQCRGCLHGNLQMYSTRADFDLLAFGALAISKLSSTCCQNVKTLADYYANIDSGQLAVDRGLRLSHDDLLRRSVIQSLLCQF